MNATSSKLKKAKSVNELIEAMSKAIYYVDPSTHYCIKRSFVDRDGTVHYLGLTRRLPYYWDETDYLNIEQFLSDELRQLDDNKKELYREKARQSLQLVLKHPTLFNRIRREVVKINNSKDMSSFRAKTGI